MQNEYIHFDVFCNKIVQCKFFVLLLSHLELTKNEQLLILKCLCISFGFGKVDIFTVNELNSFGNKFFHLTFLTSDIFI